MPLNPNLYDRLCQRFTHVRIANEGESMVAQYRDDPISRRPVLDILSWGESYILSCPFCNDTRQRLSINHRYGVPDPVTGSDNLTLVRCFNEDCLKDPRRRTALKEKVFGFLNRDQRQQLLGVKAGRRPVLVSGALTPAPPPGRLLALGQLPDGHPASAYLRDRGFDPDELSSVWHVAYCPEADPRYPLAQDRLIIPVVVNGVWAGWQARFVGERAWKVERLPKYVTMPGFPKHLALYNHDLAKEQPAVVVCEGPSDVWRVGPAGVALLGKQASRHQLRLLAKDWAGKPVIILLDGDARGDAERLHWQLEPFCGGNLVNVTLPTDRDPGGYEREELWSLIRRQASERGVRLPEMVATEPAGI